MAMTATAAVAGGAALATYLDGKYHIRKDLGLLWSLKSAERRYIKAVKENRISLWYKFADTAAKYPNNRAIWSRTGTYTFAEVHDGAVRYAQWFLDQGIGPGELVALYLQNSPEFMIIWLSLLSIGSAPAFINYNLEANALLHCLDVCQTKILLVDEEASCQSRIHGSKEHIEGRGTKIVLLDDQLKRTVGCREAKVPGDEYRSGVKGEHPSCLIYTSGTTGLPKGCAFTIGRLWLGGIEPHFDCEPGKDCWYNSMPLYHGTGAMSCISQLLCGVGIAIGPKFSVSRFWDDIHDSESTMFIYVGETARYLLNAPPHPRERDHKLRCCYGNGLRPDVWDKFRTRFNVPQVAEFFNSSEGMFGLLNWDKGDYQAAIVGHHGLILRNLLHKVYIPVMIDHETGEIWRDPKTGFAKRMPYEVGGEILVAVPNKEAFQGYWRSEGATEKKFSRDVFKKGDIYYRTGDALKRDRDGKWLFMDRLGDTFRWKSENVSTAEVAECLGKYPGIAEANVYGVLVPNHEGRAGCAAIHLDPNHKGDFSYDTMLQYIRARLPKYAVPVFVRIVKSSSHIHNHKQNKVPLRKEGVEPGKIGSESPQGKDDLILWLPSKSNSYAPFGQKEWDELAVGQTKL